jgi:hypothetical protein
MLQMGLGPQFAPRHWKLMMEEMIQEGVLKREHYTLLSPAGRWTEYAVLSLVEPIAIETLGLNPPANASEVGETELAESEVDSLLADSDDADHDS